MAYRFKHGDKSVPQALKRIAREQIDKALGEIDDDQRDAAETVHQLRKRCKKLRGLIRLVRPSFKDYAPENATFHDAAGALSDLHDARVLLATYDRSMARPARRRQTEIARDALPLGTKLLADPPAALVQRCDTYWNVWHGTIAKLAIAA